MMGKSPHSQQNNMPSTEKSGQHKTDPVMVAAGGAMMGAGLGGGFPGAIIGGVIGFLIGAKAKKDRNS